ncbi:hypothetical protein [Neptuniibacter sp.]
MLLVVVARPTTRRSVCSLILDVSLSRYPDATKATLSWEVTNDELAQ